MNITKPITFTIHAKGDWAYGSIFPAPSGGFAITMVTSFGNFGYIWNAPGDDHINFLKTMDRDYAMGKMNGGNTTEFELERTKQAALDIAKQTYEEEPEKLKRAVATIEDFFNDHFRDTNEYCVAASSGLMPFPFRDFEAIYPKESFKLGLAHFWDKLWTPIVESIEIQTFGELT